jgi:predicted Zn-dependent protease
MMLSKFLGIVLMPVKKSGSHIVRCVIVAALVINVVTRTALSVEKGTTFTPIHAEQRQDSNITLLEDVWNRLLTVVTPTAGIWPPELHVLTDEEMKVADMPIDVPNAFATIYQGAPMVAVNRALLEKIIEGNANRLAFVLGHELAHIALGHPGAARPQSTKLVATIFSRDKEQNADDAGIKMALAAGYSFNEAMVAARRFVEIGQEHPPLWPAGHPSWTQRLARLDKQRSTLWRSMGGFSNGVMFLTVEQYASAEKCFAAVVKEFPDCYEAHANLGYARLMQYCDLLTADDLRQFDIGQIMIGGFYLRPDSLIEKSRGKNSELWRQAVGSLREALRLKPDLALAQANLGIAFLVRPEGRDLEQATKYLQQATQVISRGQSRHLRPVVLVNLGVADLAAGRDDQSDQRFREAYIAAGNDQSIKATVLYNYALALLRRGDENKGDAARVLFGYLQMSNPSSIWWQLAFEKYSKLCSEQGLKCQTEQQIQAKAKPHYRPIPAVNLGGGIKVQLGDSMSEAQSRLGSARSIPVVRGTDLKRVRALGRGIDLIGADEVFAISLNSRRSPPLELQRTGTGAKRFTMRVGMPGLQVRQALGPGTVATVFDVRVPYRFYPELGLAVRFVQDRVAELLIVILPREG